MTSTIAVKSGCICCYDVSGCYVIGVINSARSRHRIIRNRHWQTAHYCTLLLGPLHRSIVLLLLAIICFIFVSCPSVYWLGYVRSVSQQNRIKCIINGFLNILLVKKVNISTNFGCLRFIFAKILIF